MKLRVTITRTSTGGQDYIQIIDDQAGMVVNVVLIADEIDIQDHRPKRPSKGK